MLNFFKHGRTPTLPQLAVTPWLFRWGISASLTLVIVFCVLTQVGGMWRIAAGLESTLSEAQQSLTSKLAVTSLQERSLFESLRAQLTVMANQGPTAVSLPAARALIAWNAETDQRMQWSGGLAPRLSAHLAPVLKYPSDFQLSKDGAYLMVPLYLTPAQKTAWRAHWLFLAVPIDTLTQTFSVCDCQWELQSSGGTSTGTLKYVPVANRVYTVPRFSLLDALDIPYTKKSYITVKTKTSHGLTIAMAYSYEHALVSYRPRVQATWFLTLTLSALFSLGYFGFVMLVWQLSDTDKWLRRIATTDELTDLPNRRNFEYVLAHEGSTISALALIDVNEFKTINDTYGHAQGDQLLATVAQRLGHQSRTRSGTPPRLGDTVYRLGGDEFAILMRGPLTKSQAEQALQRILKDTFSTPFKIGTLEVASSGSGGVAHVDDVVNPSNFFQYADIALYHAKENKGYDHCHQLKNPCCLFNLNLYTEKQNRTAMLARITEALNTQQHAKTLTSHTCSLFTGLHLVFQPKIAYADSANPTSQPYKIGYEALMRWYDGDVSKSLVPPSHFIPLIENNALMPRFGDWVLRETVSQILSWHQAGHGWQKVAINVSAAQLAQLDFHQTVAEILRQTGVPPSCLHIEITESLLTDATCALNIQKLRTAGCPIALDDFGTGYSSFEALRRFPIDYLKLDRSFIKEVHTERGAQLCKSIIDTGRAFSMTVIAEGVETPTEEELVRTLGVHQIQGFLFSKGLDPLSAIDYLPSSTSPQINLFPPEKTTSVPQSQLIPYPQAYRALQAAPPATPTNSTP